MDNNVFRNNLTFPQLQRSGCTKLREDVQKMWLKRKTFWPHFLENYFLENVAIKSDFLAKFSRKLLSILSSLFRPPPFLNSLPRLSLYCTKVLPAATPVPTTSKPTQTSVYKYKTKRLDMPGLSIKFELISAEDS